MADTKSIEAKFLDKLKKRKRKHVLCYCGKGKFPDPKKKGYLAKLGVALSNIAGMKGTVTDFFGWSDGQLAEKVAALAAGANK